MRESNFLLFAFLTTWFICQVCPHPANTGKFPAGVQIILRPTGKLKTNAFKVWPGLHLHQRQKQVPIEWNGHGKVAVWIAVISHYGTPGVVPKLGVSLPSRAFNKWSFLASKRSSSKISAARFFFLSAMRKLDVIIFRKLKHLIEKLVLLLITYYFRKDASFWSCWSYRESKQAVQHPLVCHLGTWATVFSCSSAGWVSSKSCVSGKDPTKIHKFKHRMIQGPGQVELVQVRRHQPQFG